MGKQANNGKRPLDTATPAANPKRAAKDAAAGTPDPDTAVQTDTKLVHKLRKSNDVRSHPKMK